MLGEVERLGLMVDVVLLDRAFHSVEVALLLKNQGLPFVIGARKTEGVKRLLKGLDKSQLHAIPYRMKGQTPWGQAEVEVTLVAYWGSKGWVTLLCWGVSPREAKKYSPALGNRDLLPHDKKALGPKPAPEASPCAGFSS